MYSVSQEEDPAVTTISSKNQITLPAQLLREMGLGPGDRLAVSREGDRLVLRARPKDWVRHYAGSLGGLYGGTRRQTDEYLKDLREEGARAQEIERAWSGRTNSAQRVAGGSLLDTSALIYLPAGHAALPRRPAAAVRPGAATARRAMIVSAITEAELLVRPQSGRERGGDREDRRLSVGGRHLRCRRDAVDRPPGCEAAGR